MRDRIPRYAGRVKLTPVANQQYTYDMVRADEPLQEGTPLNRNTLLSDQTAAEFGLSLDATPDEAMRFLNARRKEFENEVNSDVEKFKSDVLSAINESFKIPRGTAPALVTKSEKVSGKVVYSTETTLELNFDFNPKLIILRDHDKLNFDAKPLFFTEDLIFDHDGVTTDDGYPVGNSCTFSDDGNVKIVWYTTTTAGYVVGYVDKEYDYIAMGPGTPQSDDSGEETQITFTIGEATYTAENGMTWYEWVESEYNTIGLFVTSANSRVYKSYDEENVTGEVVAFDGTEESANEIIISNRHYHYYPF